VLNTVRARWPWSAEHGPLPALLIMLTLLTGVVDGVSYVGLGHVFVANMTGNVVFLGFALAGAPGLSAAASLIAVGGFVLGAVCGGRIAARTFEHRARHLRAATGSAVPLLLVALLIAAVAGQPVPAAARYAIIALLALSMGIQNATARRLAVPDLTTTVLTLTLTGIGADSALGGGTGGHPARRLIAVTAMFAGAFVGVLLVLRVDLVVPLGLAAALAGATALAAHRFAGVDSSWSQPPGGVGARR
jgi:uncharacterized membrane protein YoaK (UPF0700 family)